MNKLLLLFFIFFLSGCALSPNSAKAPETEDHAQMGPILDSAETFFISLKERKYGTAWNLLSERSHSAIITDVYKVSKKSGENIPHEDIKKDFEGRGLIFNSYWNAFSNSKNFDPDMVLEESRWEIGFIEENKAEIIILHKIAKHPASLQMFRENGAWKVGFSETFGTRKF